MKEAYMEIYEKMSRLQWLLQRQHMMSHAERGPFADATRGQGRVLAMLKIQPEISTKDLSYLLGIRVPSLNELLAKMERGGYIERKPSEADKRVMIIHLTEKGKAAQPGASDCVSAFDVFNEEELATLGEYLDRLITALEAQVGDESDEGRAADWFDKLGRIFSGRAHTGRLSEEEMAMWTEKAKQVAAISGVSGEQFDEWVAKHGAKHFAQRGFDGQGFEGRGGFGGCPTSPTPPPPPPKGPHDPEEE